LEVSDAGDGAFGEFEDLTVDDGEVRGAGDGFSEFADLAVVEGALDATMDATRGSIIVVGGRLGELLEDGTILIAEQTPETPAIQFQVELMTAAMDEDLMDPELDQSEEDFGGVIDATVGPGQEEAGNDADSGSVQEPGGGAAPVPARAEEERPLRASRRGRARR
jgi:hypothetical protein